MYENTKVKGEAAEVEVLVNLKRRGYRVSVPFGENSPYDLIVESPSGMLYRIQVRAASWKLGHLVLSLRCVSKNYSRTLDRSRIEAFIVWDGTTCYVVPCVDTQGCETTFSLRRDAAKNGQKKKTRDADTYANAFHLIP